MLFIFPRPLVFKHAIAHPWDAQAQTLYPLRLEGAKWIPCVMYPNFSPFIILALPLVNIFIIILLFYELGGIASLIGFAHKTGNLIPCQASNYKKCKCSLYDREGKRVKTERFISTPT
jgi:hypothetical protein